MTFGSVGCQMARKEERMQTAKSLGLLLTVALMLPLAACGGSDSNGVAGSGGTGGTGATGGTGGTDKPPPVMEPEATINSLCARFDECNQMADFFAAFGLPPGSESECVEFETVCVDENYLTPSLKEDWARLTRDCLEASSCLVFFDCWINNGLAC